MNNYHTLIITPEMSRTGAIKHIKETLAEQSGVIVIDLLDANFPLHRDFFLVLSRKFPKDRFILRCKTEKIAETAKTLGIQTEIAGLQAEFERYGPEKLATQNMGMFEYFLYEVRRGFLWIKFVLFERRKEKKMLHYKRTNYQNILIILGLIVSFVLLLFIFNFAISKTVITIKPQITVQPISANITFRTPEATGSLLETKTPLNMKRIEIPLETTQKFSVTAIDPSSSANARGTITIYNELTVAQELRPSTRFLTDEGLVFRTENWVNIPASRSLNGITQIGSIEVEVIADVNDESGKLIGLRGNIPAETNLTIPGLKFNRDKVYAKAKDNFTGGNNPTNHILTTEELRQFEVVLSEKIKKEGRELLDKKLSEDLSNTGEDYALFVMDTIRYDDPVFSVTSGHKIGDITNEIEMKAQSKIYALAMDRAATIDFLKKTFREKILNGTTKELATHPDTLRMTNIVERKNDDNEMKLTFEMNTSTIFDFENTNNEQVKQLKNILTGNSEKEAIETLINKGQANEVSIQNYPFWFRTISSNPDSIEFVIKTD